MDMITYNADEITSLLECPVCLERFDVPKLLPCQHTVCLTCLESLVEQFWDTIRCPECREEHVVPKGEPENFPTNLTLLRLLEIRSLAPCPLCKKLGKNHPCFHCDMTICRECVGGHATEAQIEIDSYKTNVESTIPEMKLLLSKATDATVRLDSQAQQMRSQITNNFGVLLQSLQRKQRDVLALVDSHFKNKRSKHLSQVLTVRSTVHVLNQCKEMLSVIEKRGTSNMSREGFRDLCKDCKSSVSKSKTLIENPIFDACDVTLPVKGDDSKHTVLKAIQFFAEQDLSVLSFTDMSKSLDILLKETKDVQEIVGEESAMVLSEDSVVEYFAKGRVHYEIREWSKTRAGILDSEPEESEFEAKLKAFSRPVGIAIAPSDGSFVVTDTGHHCVHVFTSDGTHTISFGKLGLQYGDFRHPCGVAISSEDEIVVADQGNSRIQIFSMQGEFIRSFGWQTEGERPLRMPVGVAVDAQDNIYITESERQSIIKCSMDGYFIEDIACAYDDLVQFISPNYITVGHGRIAISDTCNHKLHFFDLSGSPIASIGRDYHEGGVKVPRGVTFTADGHLLVVDVDDGQIKVFDTNGQMTCKFAMKGYHGSSVDWADLVCTADGKVIVIDEGSNSIKFY